MVHPPHLDDSQKAEKHGVEEHQNAVTEALLDRVQIVGVKAHEISYLIDLVVFLREHAAVVEHLVAEIGLVRTAALKKQTRHRKRPKTMARMIQIIGRQILSSRTSMVNAMVCPSTTTSPLLVPLITMR